MLSGSNNRKFRQETGRNSSYGKAKRDGSSTVRTVLVLVVVVGGTFFAFIFPGLISPDYLAHNFSCSIASYNSTVGHTIAQCNGTALQGRGIPTGTKLPLNSIFWSFRVTRNCQFTLQFSANESLIAFLNDTTSGKVILQLDQPSLVTTIYELTPDNYTLIIANQNPSTVGFTIDAYAGHDAISQI